ncbi:MAG TPA: hypothetical protein VIS06_21935 [Mycobacteriales bacterium]
MLPSTIDDVARARMQQMREDAARERRAYRLTLASRRERQAARAALRARLSRDAVL